MWRSRPVAIYSALRCRDVSRLGRKTPLKQSQRLALWSIFEKVRTRVFDDGAMTEAGMFERFAVHFKNGVASPYDFAVVDEAQDISITQLRFLSALGAKRPNGLFSASSLPGNDVSLSDHRLSQAPSIVDLVVHIVG